MATKRLRKGESVAQRVAKIEGQIKTWRTKHQRAVTALSKLEKQRTYYARKLIEQGAA